MYVVQTYTQYTMEASFLEIYNETIRDLLSSNSAPSSTPSHEIKRDPNTPGEVYVTSLTPVTVTSEIQVSRHVCLEGVFSLSVNWNSLARLSHTCSPSLPVSVRVWLHETRITT